MISVVQIFRKTNPSFFSIEKVFSIIEPQLQHGLQLESLALPRHSRGIAAIWKNIQFLRKRKQPGRLYHITGDVHYTVLAFPPQTVLLTIHDCVFLYAASGFKRAVLKWLFLDMPVKRAALVTTISAFTRQEIIRFTGCPADKIVVIPNPVNDAIYFNDRAFNTEKPAILFVGTTPNKNLERTVEALAGVSCKLVILGKINDGQAQLLQKHGIEFSAVSNLTEKELADLYAATDIVLFPSTFEGFGLPILEGQKAGRVVITSNIDPMKTVAGGGALLVDPYDAVAIRSGILAVMADAGLRDTLLKRGFDNMQHYSITAVAAAYLQVYKKLAENK